MQFGIYAGYLMPNYIIWSRQ